MFISLVAALALACGVYDEATVTERALDGDEDAIAELREEGQPGLDRLLTQHRELVTSDPRWERLIDRVAAQRYATHSALFWHTDLEAAKATARASGKAILSLRLLGRLDEELSCANSRFFRTMLYPDPSALAVLRAHYVLHWESVANAPKITIDFGHGRTLTRTITGNSLHYVLSSRGDVVDVMPGLVGPDTFGHWLAIAAPVATRLGAEADPAKRSHTLANHHARVHEALLSQWQILLRRVGIRAKADHESLAAASTPTALESIASGRRVHLSREARSLVESLMPPAPDLTIGAPGFRPGLAFEAMPIAIGKSRVERPVLDKLGSVLASLSLDELNNAFPLRSRALGYAVGAPIGTATAAIYADLFKTPLDDPWMGLAPLDVFTALPAHLERGLPARHPTDLARAAGP